MSHPFQPASFVLTVSIVITLRPMSAPAQCGGGDWTVQTVTAAPVNNPSPKPGWHLIFDDEFNGDALDESLWSKRWGQGDIPKGGIIPGFFVDVSDANIHVGNGLCVLSVIYAPGWYKAPWEQQSFYYYHTGSWIGSTQLFGPGMYWELRAKRNGIGYKSSAWSFNYESDDRAAEGISLFDNDFPTIAGSIKNPLRENWFESFEHKAGDPIGHPTSHGSLLDFAPSIPASNDAYHTYAIDCSEPDGNEALFYVNNKLSVQEFSFVPHSNSQTLDLWCMPLYWKKPYQDHPEYYQPGGLFPENSFSIDYVRVYKKNSEVARVIDDFGNAQAWTSQRVRPRLIADVNGDGKQDVIGFGINNTSVSLSDPGQHNIGFLSRTNVLADYTAEQGWSSQDTHPRVMADVDGDGRADIVGFGAQAVVVSLSSCSATTPSFQSPAWTLYDYTVQQGWSDQLHRPRMVADVDGDGLADIVGFGWSAVNVSLSTSTSGVPSFTTPAWVIDDFTVEQGWADQQLRPRALADIDGDGRADIVGFGWEAVRVSLSTSSGGVPSFADPVWVLTDFTAEQGWTTQDARPRLLADINGDGKADIVGFGYGGTYVSVNTTQNNICSFASPVWCCSNFTIEQGFLGQSTHPRFVADVNNDGRADIVGCADQMIEVALSLSTGITAAFAQTTNFINDFTPCKGWGDMDAQPRALADANGDGCVDLIGFGYDGVLAFEGIGGTCDLPVSVTGSNETTSDDWDLPGADGRDVAYRFYLRASQTVRLVLDPSVTTYPAVMQLFDAGAGTPVGPASQSQLVLSLAPGYYYAVVDGMNGATGTFKLDVVAN